MPTTGRCAMSWQIHADRIATTKGFKSLDEFMTSSNILEEKPEPENQPRPVAVEARENWIRLENTWSTLEEIPNVPRSTSFETNLERVKSKLWLEDLGSAKLMLAVLHLVALEQCPQFYDRPNTVVTIRVPMWALALVMGGYSDRHGRRIRNANAGELQRWVSWTDCTSSWMKFAEDGQPSKTEAGKLETEARSCGLVWVVRSSPLPVGETMRPALTEELQALKVDLDEARRNNQTLNTANVPLGDRPSRAKNPVTATMSASLNPIKEEGILFLKNLTAPPVSTDKDQYPDTDISRQTVIFALHDLPVNTKKPLERRVWVDSHAHLIARALGEPSGVNNWRKALWGVLKAARVGELKPAQTLIDSVDRALLNSSESRIRSPGRLLSSYLVKHRFAEMVRPYEHVRAGPNPKHFTHTQRAA
jgi:hypothetical protein